MTDEEIDDFQEGQHLDVIIAEKIMGCKVKLHGPKKQYVTCGCSDYHIHNQLWNERNDDLLADYSTEIVAAWEVVKKMRDLGYQLELRTYLSLNSDLDVNTICRFLKSPPLEWMRKEFWQTGNDGTSIDTPLSICRAALKAVNYDSSNS